MFDFNRALKKGSLNEFNDPFTKKYKQCSRDQITDISPANLAASQCKVSFIDGDVYAAATFYPGDVVEMCPCKMIENDLGDELKELTFEVDEGKYAVPFGYAQWYKLSDETISPNCDYEFDPNNNVIVIRATEKIMKGDVLCLDSTYAEDDENETDA